MFVSDHFDIRRIPYSLDYSYRMAGMQCALFRCRCVFGANAIFIPCHFCPVQCGCALHCACTGRFCTSIFHMNLLLEVLTSWKNRNWCVLGLVICTKSGVRDFCNGISQQWHGCSTPTTTNQCDQQQTNVERATRHKRKLFAAVDVTTTTNVHINSDLTHTHTHKI